MRRAPHSRSKLSHGSHSGHRSKDCCDTVGTSQAIVDAFLAGDAPGVLELIDEETILDVVDASGNIPYAGIYHGPAGVAQFLATLTSLTVSQNRFRDLTTVGDGGNTVIITIGGSTTLRCSPNSAISQVFPTTLYLTFKYRCCRLKKITVVQDTSTQAEFFANCPDT